MPRIPKRPSSPSSIRARLMPAVASQLARPHGALGRAVAVALNRGNREPITAAVQLCEAAPGDVVADIGFGGGAGLRLLLDKVGGDGVVHGIDISPAMVDRARARNTKHLDSGRLRIAEGSLTALPLPDASLDAAITVNTVYFVADLDRACTELARTLRPHGRVVIAIGDPEAMARLPYTRYEFTLRPITTITAALERAGLDVEATPRFAGAIPGYLLVARRKPSQ